MKIIDAEYTYIDIPVHMISVLYVFNRYFNEMYLLLTIIYIEKNT